VPTPRTKAGSSASNNDGTTLATLTPAERAISASATGSERSPPVATASVPPAARVTATSNTAASKLNEANCNTTTPSPTPNTGRIAAARFATPRCATATPFGQPVDPEVYITYAN
jgi:hypothetical protein